eukprot:PhF_6_TR12646/c0_g1_i1/m.20059/K17914/KIF13; kinesin family member 13
MQTSDSQEFSSADLDMAPSLTFEPSPADLANQSSSNVQAIVRVRPFDANREGDFSPLLTVNGSRVEVLDPPQSFEYDSVFWSVKPDQTKDKTPFSSQEDVYRGVGISTMDNIWNGYNVCIFAYGQTGSGKTYTMMGNQEEPGLIPRICDALIAERNTRTTNKGIDEQVAFNVKIEVRYFEIYNEKVQDLLATLRKGAGQQTGPGGKPVKSTDLKVRNHPIHGPYVEGCEAVEVQSSSDIMKLLEVGNAERTVASTKMNDRSSRSHALFRLQVTQLWTQEAQGPGQKPTTSERVSTLNLVDLAGSERIKASGVSGVELTQATNINLSLTTLRRVIDALIETAKQPKSKIKIPYRESVLTFLLSVNLGGNSKTTMIATVSPHSTQAYETLNTLNYAMRAKSIVCSVKVNEDNTAKMLADLQAKFNMLQSQQTVQSEEEKQENAARLEALQQAMEEISTREKDLTATVEAAKEIAVVEKTKRIAHLFQHKVKSVVTDTKVQELQDNMAKERATMQEKIQELTKELEATNVRAAEQLKRETVKNEMLVVKDSKRRQEFQAKTQAFEDEKNKLLEEITRLKDVEEEHKKLERELADYKRKRAVEQLQHESDTKQAEERLWDSKRLCDKLAAEVADLKCTSSIIEHKLNSEKFKVVQHDTLQEDLMQARNQITILEQQLEQSRSSLKTEQLRFARD